MGNHLGWVVVVYKLGLKQYFHFASVFRIFFDVAICFGSGSNVTIYIQYIIYNFVGSIFYVGIALLGFGTGIATVSNLSLMFDLTVREKIGLYIGAWGFSNGLSRGVGLLMAGIVADVATKITGDVLYGYVIVFGIEALMMLIAAIMLSRIDVGAFQKKAHEPAFADKVAIVAD